MEKKKKGVSPVVSTVLLIMVVVIIAIIILLWSFSVIKEAVTKDIAGVSKAAEQYCAEVRAQPIINQDGSFGFNNNGFVPIYEYNLKLTEAGTGRSIVKKILAENGGTVNPGFNSIINDPEVKSQGNYQEVKMIPILLGKGSKTGSVKQYECPERDGIVLVQN